MPEYLPPIQKGKMTDSDLSAILSAKSRYAVGYWDGKISHDRVKADRYYRGEPFGNEQDNRSQVVSRDVAEVIDGIMPSLIRIFQSGRDVVKFEAREEKDVQKAEQATQYVNHIWNQQNEGFNNTYTWFKSALINRVGVLKIFWEDKTDQRKSYYEGADEAQYKLLEDNPDVEILEVIEYEDEEAREQLRGMIEENAEQLVQKVQQTGQVPELPEIPKLYDIECIETERTGQVVVLPIPPEEFIINSRAIDTEEVTYLAHRTQMTTSDLIAQGFDRDVVESLPSYGLLEYSTEVTERHFLEDELPFNENETFDRASREVEITEHYTKIDYDGDGIAELRKIVTAGDETSVILSNEMVDDHPFATLSPIPLPFKFFGQSVADQTMDLQLMKSTLWRQSLDNVYNTNNQRHVVSPGVRMDDMLNSTPGGVIRAQNPTSDVVALPITPILNNTIQMIEYVDTVRENRTGVTRYNQGLDAETLNNTATGATIHDKNGQQRIELIARVFAETGYKTAMQKILKLTLQHQRDTRSYKLNGEFVSIDPKEWKSGFDTAIMVGLGASNDLGATTALSGMTMLTEKIVQVQEGTDGPLITRKNIYNQMKHLGEAGGLANMDLYISNPDKMPKPKPKQPQEDPNVAMAKATVQAEQIRAQQKAEEAAAKLLLEERKMQMDFDLKAEEMRLKYELEALKIGGEDISYTPTIAKPPYNDIVDPNLAPFPPDITQGFQDVEMGPVGGGQPAPPVAPVPSTQGPVGPQGPAGPPGPPTDFGGEPDPYIDDEGA